MESNCRRKGQTRSRDGVELKENMTEQGQETKK